MSIKVVHVSDTHLKEFSPEGGDILVHSGDALNYGSFRELVQFSTQLEKIKDRYKHIIFVPGNHDRAFEEEFTQCKTFLLETINNLVILNHEYIELEGLKIFGTPLQPYFCNWAFNVKDNLDLLEMYEQIPKNIDLLITHCPPIAILDKTMYNERVGSKALSRVLPELKNLQAHLFGHIHYSAGLERLNNVQYSNAAICGENYMPINKPNIIILEEKKMDKEAYDLIQEMIDIVDEREKNDKA